MHMHAHEAVDAAHTPPDSFFLFHIITVGSGNWQINAVVGKQMLFMALTNSGFISQKKISFANNGLMEK